MREIHKKISPEYFEVVLSGEKTLNGVSIISNVNRATFLYSMNMNIRTVRELPRVAIRPVARFVNALAMLRALRIWIGWNARMLRLISKHTANK